MVRMVTDIQAQELQQRIRANEAWHDEFRTAGDLEKAATYLERAFSLSRWNHTIGHSLISLLLEMGAFDRARSVAHRTLQRVVADANYDALSRAYSRWLYFAPAHLGREHYEYDFDILAGMEKMGQRLQPDAATKSQDRSGNGKRRLLYIGSNLTAEGSVLAKVLNSMLAMHDMDDFEIMLAFTEPASRVENSAEARMLTQTAMQKGISVATAEAATLAEFVKLMAQRLSDWQPELLVTNAGFVCAEAILLAQAVHVPRRCALVVGPPQVFTSPSFDFSITSDERLLMECPGDGAVVPVETHLPSREGLALAGRSSLGIPEDATIVVGAGRYVKFGPEYCKILGNIIAGSAKAYLLLLGIPEDRQSAILGLIPASARSRTRFVPWTPDYLPYLGLGDLLIDTFPYGGGVTVQDAMALGIPCICVGDDLHNAYRSDEWSVAYKFTLPELVAPPGDGAWIERMAIELLESPARLSTLAKKCRDYVIAARGDVARMTRRHEDVFKRLIDES